MQIILIKDVENLGYANEIVDVRPGYANNYLIPQGYAKNATASARKILAENIKQQAHKEAKLVADAETMVAALAASPVTISVKAEEGRIFGSVTSTNIAEALEAKGVVVDKKNITVDAIKTVGQYEATVKVFKGITGTVSIEVVAAE